MMKKFSLALLALATALAITPAQSVWATTIPVNNADFSAQSSPFSNPCAGICTYTSPGFAITDWTNSGDSGLWNPTSTYFTSSTGATNVAFSNGPTISQTVGATVQAGHVYTLTVEIGNRLDGSYWDNPGANLLVTGTDGGTYYATGTEPAQGDFSVYTATFTGNALNAGDSITIDLTTSGDQGDFSAVSLVSNPTPEPSSLLLLGTGLLGLAFVAFRKVKASGLA
jgi:hypothetical protein